MSDRVIPVVASKLQPPPLRRDVVRRERLLSSMTRGFGEGASVGLVCAPAGSGKSTLIGSYLDETGGEVVWLQVDSHDNDAARFWTHLWAAIRQLVPEGPSRIQPTWFRAGDWSSVVNAVIAELQDIGSVTLVVDDYHHIRSGVVHEQLDQLLQWLPPQASVLISSRLDPPMPCLGRLRVRGTLVEVRATDLAFDPADAAELLTSAADSEVTPAGAAELVARTEGWAAGLYLAGLSIRRHGDPGLVLDAFDGDDRLVADYLRSEFLAELDDETRRFMLATSILDELSGPLCDTVQRRRIQRCGCEIWSVRTCSSCPSTPRGTATGITTCWNNGCGANSL